MDALNHRKRSRVDSDETGSVIESTKVKRIRDDLLSLLDDSDTIPDRDPVSHDLDSVIRSFEEEISGSGFGSVSVSTSPAPDPATLVDLTVDSGEPLLGFGDFSGSELNGVLSESSRIGELWEFQDDLPSYDPFEFGLDYEQSNITGDVENQGNGNEYVALDGIFDYSDVNFGSDFSWRAEILPAL